MRWSCCSPVQTATYPRVDEGAEVTAPMSRQGDFCRSSLRAKGRCVLATALALSALVLASCKGPPAAPGHGSEDGCAACGDGSGVPEGEGDEPPPVECDEPKEAGSGEDELPEFEWPPPKPSASVFVPRDLVLGADAAPTLGSSAARLEAALTRAGFAEWGYYHVPGGFALVSRLEQIERDGNPHRDRWAVDVSPRRAFSLWTYVSALFSATTGRFRVIVFVVTDTPFRPTAPPPDGPTAIAWLEQGMTGLPAPVRGRPYTTEHTCKALIYEFFKATPDHDAAIELPSHLDGRAHLTKAGIWGGLGG